MPTQDQVQWLASLGVDKAMLAGIGADEQPGTSGEAAANGVSLHLPDASDAHAAKAPAKPDKPAKPVAMEKATLKYDMSGFEERFKRVTGQIMHTVEINALLLGAGIESGCIDFKNYADEKIEKLKHAEEMDKLALEILEVATVAISAGFGAVMIEGEIAKEVFKTLAEGTIKVVKAKAEPNSSADFMKFVDSLISGAKQAGHDAGSAAIEIVRRTVKAAEKAYHSAENDGVSLSGSKDYTFVEHFLFEDASRFDHLVTRFCGIPSPEMVNKVQIKMTGDMIHRFAEKLIRATRDPILGVIDDHAGEDSFRVAEDAMRILKKRHKFNYED